MNQLMRHFVEPIRYIYYLIKDDEYRKYNYLILKYGKKKRFKEEKVSISKNESFLVPDVASFLSTYKELFVDNIYEYKVSDEKRANVIIDFGANIGLSLYFFAKNYPDAEIEGYEADPFIYKYLEQNVANNIKSDHVKIYNRAVWNKDTKLKFYSEGADGGRIKKDGGNSINIEAVDVVDILKKHEIIDFLKIDIEGAERMIVPAMKNQLKKVKKIFIEYHSEKNQPQCLAEIIGILSETGFRIYVHQEFVSKQPLKYISYNADFDLQLEIFGVRE